MVTGTNTEPKREYRDPGVGAMPKLVKKAGSVSGLYRYRNNTGNTGIERNLLETCGDFI